MLLFALTAHALTLPEALDRAAQMDPDTIIADLYAQQARSATGEAVARMTLNPSLAYSQVVGSPGSTTFGVSLSLLDPPLWFAALAQGADARGAEATYRATANDAQFAVAALWYQAYAADEAEELAQASLSEARATADAAEARLRAGLASELDAKAARLGVLNAQATLASAQSNRFVGLARLESALQTEVERADVAPVPGAAEGAGESPWVAVYEQSVVAARWDQVTSYAELLPSVGLSASRGLSSTSAWSVVLSATWSFSGVVAPVFDVQQASINRRVAVVRLDAFRRQQELDRAVARAQMDAARARRSAAIDGERLAGETVAVGRARLGAGLISTLDLLQLQAQEASARVQRVSAELDLALAVLDSRRLAGLPPL